MKRIKQIIENYMLDLPGIRIWSCLGKIFQAGKKLVKTWPDKVMFLLAKHTRGGNKLKIRTKFR